MKGILTHIRVGLLLMLAVLSTGCGGFKPTTAPTPAVAVLVTPATSQQVVQGATLQFLAKVAGASDQRVVWSIQEGAAGGTITTGGLYTAPAHFGEFHVVATSQADPSKTGVVIVTVPDVVVSIEPRNAALLPGTTLEFRATVSGTVNKDVIWSIQEGTAGGTVSNGSYTAPSDTGGPFHVIVASAADPAKNAIAEVTITGRSPGGSFQSTGSMLTPRSFHAATRLQDGRVLITGGISVCCIALATAEIYSPDSGSFSPTSDTMGVARAGHTATLLSDGRVLVAGGWDAEGSTSAAEIYEPDTKTFSSAGDMTVARSGHTATLLDDGRVLIVGGVGSGDASTGSAELYDPATGVFAPAGALWAVDHAYGHTATRLSNGNVLIAGGVTSSDFVLGNTELYDPASGTFKATGLLVRYFHTATLLNDGRVLMAGGSGGNFVAASAEVYEPSSGSFTATGSMLQKRWLSTANLLASGRVLVAGGRLLGDCGLSDECGLPTNVTELYDPVAGTFSPASSMAYGRESHTATLLLDGRVLVTGGKTESGSTSSAELYDPN